MVTVEDWARPEACRAQETVRICAYAMWRTCGAFGSTEPLGPLTVQIFAGPETQVIRGN